MPTSRITIGSKYLEIIVIMNSKDKTEDDSARI